MTEHKKDLPAKAQQTYILATASTKYGEKVEVDGKKQFHFQNSDSSEELLIDLLTLKKNRRVRVHP